MNRLLKPSQSEIFHGYCMILPFFHHFHMFQLRFCLLGCAQNTAHCGEVALDAPPWGSTRTLQKEQLSVATWRTNPAAASDHFLRGFLEEKLGYPVTT
jgi:hypothetical protein